MRLRFSLVPIFAVAVLGVCGLGYVLYAIESAGWQSHFALIAVICFGLGIGALLLWADKQRQKAETASRHYRLLLKSAVDGIHILDESGNLVEASDSFFNMLGYEIQKDSKLHVSDWDKKIESDSIKTRIAYLVDNQGEFEAEHTKKDGNVFTAEINVRGFVLEGKSYLYASSRDISERRQLEEKLRLSEERFRSLVESTTDWVWETDQNHQFSWISESFETVIGFPKATILGKTRWDLSLTDIKTDDALWSEHRDDLTQRRKFRDFRYWVRNPHGDARWIKINGSPMIDAQGNFLGYRGSGSEVTDQAATALRMKTLSTVVDQSPMSVVVTNADGLIEYVNPHFTRVTGYQPEDVIGKNPRIFASGKTLPNLYQELWKTLTEKRRWAGELLNRRKDGALYWERIVISPLLNARDQITHFVAIREDISKTKALEADRQEINAALLSKAVEFKQVLETAADGLLGVDEQFQVKFANPAAAQILGWASPEDLQGRDAVQLLGHLLADGQPCADTTCAVRATFLDGQIRRLATGWFTRSDGELVPVQYAVSPLVVLGRTVGTVLAFQDISERKALEDDLRQSNAELEQFAYVASHDLRQPLRMIGSYIELIEQQLSAQLTDDLKTYFHYVFDGAKRMDRLILDLLQYSRTGRGREVRAVPLKSAALEALRNLEVSVQESGARVSIAEDLSGVIGSATDITRLFQNLIGNAIQYRSSDRPAIIEVGWQRKADQLLIWVKDNGRGIAPADFDRVFMIFQRLVPKSSSEGSGIGLAICKKIVEQHGGKIWIESVVGQGSSFFLTLQSASLLSARVTPDLPTRGGRP